MPSIYLVEGPVGSGKSTIAMTLSQEHSAPRLILDEWMSNLFGPDRPETGSIEWYLERKERCLDQIWNTTTGILTSGISVVLELGLIRQSDRIKFHARMESIDCPLLIYVVDAPRELRKERVLQRNKVKGATFFMEVPEHIFELASDMWEPIDEAECSNCTVHYMESI